MLVVEVFLLVPTVSGDDVAGPRFCVPLPSSPPRFRDIVMITLDEFPSKASFFTLFFLEPYFRHYEVTVESGGNFEDYSVWSGESWSEWEGWERSGEKGLIISDNQAETCLIITIDDITIGDLPLIITISDTCKNKTKSLDFDDTINLSRLIVSLAPGDIPP